MLYVLVVFINGFSFWMIGDDILDLQMIFFIIFQFIFVVFGVIVQLQLFFIDCCNIFEVCEKKSKMYFWIVFVMGLIMFEIFYFMICGVLYYCCWYYIVGFFILFKCVGVMLFVMFMYEFVYMGMGQFIVVYVFNVVFVLFVNFFVIGILVVFCGVLVFYVQIQVFWRYWIYYFNFFNYFMGFMLVFVVWDWFINCNFYELVRFDFFNGIICGDYLSIYFEKGYGMVVNLLNFDVFFECQVCQFKFGSDYFCIINLMEYSYGWRDVGIVVIFVISLYVMVYGLMKLRIKISKKVE